MREVVSAAGFKLASQPRTALCGELEFLKVEGVARDSRHQADSRLVVLKPHVAELARQSRQNDIGGQVGDARLRIQLSADTQGAGRERRGIDGEGFQQCRNLELPVELGAGIFAIRIVAGRCLQGHKIAARSLEVQIQRLDVEVLEFGQRGIGGQFELQPANGFTADGQADVVESGLQRGLQILAVTGGPNRELCGNGGRRDVRAGQRLPVGGFQPVDRQLEGGVRNSLTRLGPGQGHRLIETAVDESAPGLGDRQPERF